jgi:pyruvate,water dikinase
MTAASRVVPAASLAAERYTRALETQNDVALVGGKAHALGRAIRAGLRVPPGFAITTRALDEHLDAHDLRARIDQVCGNINEHDRASLSECSRRVRDIVTSVPISSELRDEIFACAETLLACGPVVVRSSAVGEDSHGQSFAGQLDSFLHVTTLSALERAVLACWASYWSERALSYRAARSAPVQGMGVVVQQQLDARAAGVLFTDAGDATMLVEYTAGLGDALVAGAINPGRLSIDRETREVRQLADASEEFSLDAVAIDSLATAGEQLEREFGAPQDVEWVLAEDGAIWIVQSRPITAPVVAPRPAAPNASSKRVVWSNANVNENFPGPVSPLLYSIAAPGYSNYFRNLAHAFGISPRRIRAMEPAFRQIIGVHGARMYYNLTSIHSVLRLAPFGKALAASFDTFVGADGTGVAAEALDRRPASEQLKEVAVIAVRTAWQYRSLEKRIARFEETVDQFAERTSATRLKTTSGVELRDALRGFMDIRLNRWLDASLADAASMVCYGALQRLLENAYGAKSSVHTLLLKAIPDVISGEPVHRLWELSRLIRRDDALRALFEYDAGRVLDRLGDDSRFAEFNAAFERYLEDWGFRCSEELMLTSPSFQENPAPLIDMLRAYARLGGPSPVEALRDQANARRAETTRVLAELDRRSLWRGMPGLTYGRALRVLLPWTHAAIRFRERARLKQALLYSRCRRIALAVGDHLAARATIVVRDDVFFLTVQELDELLSGAAMFPHDVQALVRARRRAHERLAATAPPDAFTLGEGEYLENVATPESEASTAVGEVDATLRGTSACGGTVTGRATVLRDVTEAARLARGDVLVTRQTDPGWGPVFFLIAGLVIERGGMLSHGAIIAREFGIPCVVGVRDAMRAIPDRATITVHGDGGWVHVDA